MFLIQLCSWKFCHKKTIFNRQKIRLPFYKKNVFSLKSLFFWKTLSRTDKIQIKSVQNSALQIFSNFIWKFWFSRFLFLFLDWGDTWSILTVRQPWEDPLWSWIQIIPFEIWLSRFVEQKLLAVGAHLILEDHSFSIQYTAFSVFFSPNRVPRKILSCRN